MEMCSLVTVQISPPAAVLTGYYLTAYQHIHIRKAEILQFIYLFTTRIRSQIFSHVKEVESNFGEVFDTLIRVFLKSEEF